MPLEERRFKEMKEDGFGEAGQDQAQICSNIMAKTHGVSIEMSSAKDKSLTVVLTGKGDAVMRARKLVVQQLQTQVGWIQIILRLCGFILGWGGWGVLAKTPPFPA